MLRLATSCLLFLVAAGCQSARPPFTFSTDHAHSPAAPETSFDLPPADEVDPPASDIVLVSAQQDDTRASEADEVSAFQTGPTVDTEQPSPSVISLDRVIQSVHSSFPLIRAAYLERNVASGQVTSAWGEFDTKIKAISENGPLGFYETYRNSAGVSRPLYDGGNVFAGYRNGGGDFQPWYQERETNDGGEFKAGVRLPMIRNRDIDARRAALWRANYDRQLADPTIRTALIEFSREAGLAYWKWVAAGQKYAVDKRWLELARIRNEQIRKRVEANDLDPPELVDNERAIAKREAKLADSLRILRQAAAKLSLFLRDENGVPIVPPIDPTPGFPTLRLAVDENLESDVSVAMANSPQIQALDLKMQQMRVDYAEASNMTRAALDVQLAGSQDVGQPTSKKRDKSEFEIEAGLYFEVPVQRRKGLGKMNAVQAKMAQVTAKRQLVTDKVRADVQAAYAGLQQSYQEVVKARRAVELADRMAEIERVRFREGESDMLKVALREQYAVDSAQEVVSATYNHFVAFTYFLATLGIERPEIDRLPAAANQNQP